jgi:hypothetical protein
MLLTQKDDTMKLDLGWAELSLAAIVAVISIGGSYAASAYREGRMEQRVITLEVNYDRMYPILYESNKNTGDMKIILGRMDERLKSIERKGP